MKKRKKKREKNIIYDKGDEKKRNKTEKGEKRERERRNRLALLATINTNEPPDSILYLLSRTCKLWSIFSSTTRHCIAMVQEGFFSSKSLLPPPRPMVPTH